MWHSHLLLDIYSREIKRYVYTKTCIGSPNLEATQMFIKGEWVNKLHYIHKMDYQLVIESNELLIYITWMNLRMIMLSKRS